MDACPFCVQCPCGKSEAREDRPGFAESREWERPPALVTPEQAWHWARVDAVAAGYATVVHIKDPLCRYFATQAVSGAQGGTVWLRYAYIGRAYRAPLTRRWQQASPWHNPFKIGPDGDRAQCCALYHDYIETRPELLTRLGELAGRVLVCWCAPEACHGEELLRRLGDGSYERYQAAVAGYRITEGRAR